MQEETTLWGQSSVEREGQHNSFGSERAMGTCAWRGWLGLQFYSGHSIIIESARNRTYAEPPFLVSLAIH